jgi:hypothetical protein
MLLPLDFGELENSSVWKQAPANEIQDDKQG